MVGSPVKREELGVEPICRMPSEQGCPIAPSTYDAAEHRFRRPGGGATPSWWRRSAAASSDSSGGLAGLVHQMALLLTLEQPTRDDLGQILIGGVDSEQVRR